MTYTQDLPRLDGAPRIMRFPGVGRIVFRISSKYMRRGFDGLLALAEERSGRGWLRNRGEMRSLTREAHREGPIS
jgi:hypothetical protein